MNTFDLPRLIILIILSLKSVNSEFDSSIKMNDLVMCQPAPTDDCAQLVDRMLQCQEIIFHDRGFSYQQYRENIQIHREMLSNHQLKCSGNNVVCRSVFRAQICGLQEYLKFILTEVQNSLYIHRFVDLLLFKLLLNESHSHCLGSFFFLTLD